MKSRTLHFECQRIKTLMQPLSQGLHLPLSDTLFGCCCSLFQSLQLKYFTDIFLVNSTSMLSLRFLERSKSVEQFIRQAPLPKYLMPIITSWNPITAVSFGPFNVTGAHSLDLSNSSKPDTTFNYFTFQCIRASNGLGKVKARTSRPPKMYYWESHAGDRNYMLTVVKCSSHSS